MRRAARVVGIAIGFERCFGGALMAYRRRRGASFAFWIALAAIAAFTAAAGAYEAPESDPDELATEAAQAADPEPGVETQPILDAPESTEDFSKWLPSLTLGFDVHRQIFETSGTSDLGFTTSESETVLTSLFSVDAALSTPPLMDEFGSPRLFGQIGAQIPLSDQFTILRTVKSFPPEGGPNPPPPITEPDECPELGGPMNKRSCDQSLESELTLNWTWSAGLGSEFTLPFFDRDLKIRTAFNYFGQALDFTGTAKRDDRAGGTAGQNGAIVETLRIGGATKSKTLHAIGPELTLSGEVGRAGPVSLGVFAEARFYWLLNGGAIQYGASNANGTASFSANPDSLIAQGGAGLRITWEGYESERREAGLDRSDAAPIAIWHSRPGRTATWNTAPSRASIPSSVADARHVRARPAASDRLPDLSNAGSAAPDSYQLASVFPSSVASPVAGSDAIDEDEDPAVEDGESSEIARKAFDGAALRPLYFLRFVAGCALAVPVAIVSLPGGFDNVGDNLDYFVGEPYRDTFQASLGNF